MKKRRLSKEAKELLELGELMGGSTEEVPFQRLNIWQATTEGDSISGIIQEIRDVVLNRKERKNIVLETAKGRILLDVALSDMILEQANIGDGVLVQFKGMVRGSGRFAGEHKDYKISLLRKRHK